MDEEKQSRRGRTPIDLSLKRNHCVSVRVNNTELNWLDKNRGEFRRGEYLRMAALDKLPPVIPELNKKAWSELANAGNNLNQIAKKLNSDEQVSIDEIRKELMIFRNSLLGIEQ